MSWASASASRRRRALSNKRTRLSTGLHIHGDSRFFFCFPGCPIGKLVRPAPHHGRPSTCCVSHFALSRADAFFSTSSSSSLSLVDGCSPSPSSPALSPCSELPASSSSSSSNPLPPLSLLLPAPISSPSTASSSSELNRSSLPARIGRRRVHNACTHGTCTLHATGSTGTATKSGAPSHTARLAAVVRRFRLFDCLWLEPFAVLIREACFGSLLRASTLFHAKCM